MKATIQCTNPRNALRIATQTELRIAKLFTENKIYIEQQIIKTIPPGVCTIAGFNEKKQKDQNPTIIKKNYL